MISVFSIDAIIACLLLFFSPHLLFVKAWCYWNDLGTRRYWNRFGIVTVTATALFFRLLLSLLHRL
jgi:hypothetical protein